MGCAQIHVLRHLNSIHQIPCHSLMMSYNFVPCSTNFSAITNSPSFTCDHVHIINIYVTSISLSSSLVEFVLLLLILRPKSPKSMQLVLG